ncbi:hypothetical protein [uncultured Draconibacterium sp.]|uniref:hypothetical protein n=1 Tax=uncultured Draconibacterium sp. TaxID=1573823 RepID=UPI0025FB7377|nr:hypothetical protein [uncultured Draconibacterium sp.]
MKKNLTYLIVRLSLFSSDTSFAQRTLTGAVFRNRSNSLPGFSKVEKSTLHGT